MYIQNLSKRPALAKSILNIVILLYVHGIYLVQSFDHINLVYTVKGTYTIFAAPLKSRRIKTVLRTRLLHIDIRSKNISTGPKTGSLSLFSEESAVGSHSTKRFNRSEATGGARNNDPGRNRPERRRRGFFFSFAFSASSSSERVSNVPALKRFRRGPRGRLPRP